MINSLALRPLYPLILTAVGILVEGGILVLARADPTVVWVEDPALVFAGAASSVGLFIAHAIYLGIVGGALAFMTRGARRTFRDAVELEVEQARLLREQGEIVMEGRLVALGKLVAGLSHEINTPVAVLKSNATTIGTALKLIRGALPKTDPKMERVLDVPRQGEQRKHRGERTGRRLLFFTLNREDFSFVIHLDRQPRTSRRREAQTGSRARSERTLDAVEHSRTLMEWWPFLIFHRGGLRIKVINNNATLQTLRSFARLDNAELGHSDLSADLDGVWSSYHGRLSVGRESNETTVSCLGSSVFRDVSTRFSSPS